MATYATQTTEVDFKRECEGLVREYFTHGVVHDVVDSLKELLGRPGWTENTNDRRSSIDKNSSGLSPLGNERSSTSPLGNGSSTSNISVPSPLALSASGHTLSAATLRSMVVKRAVIAALDRGARERELAAQLLAQLRRDDCISRAHGEAGFDLLLQALESLTIDVPNAPDNMHVFLARAVVDDVVSDEFLEECADAAGLDIDARRVALSARGALRAPGGKGRVLDAWGGPDGGTASFAVREMDSLLHEYVESRDSREASRRIAELHVPFYHHELVKRALVMAIEEARVRPQCVRRITELLGYLGAAGVVSGTQFAKGFARVAVALKELVLDTPDAQELFERLVVDARGRGLLPAGLSAWASIRVGGASSFGDSDMQTSSSGKEEKYKPETPSMSRSFGSGRGGHLMRLDSAPDLIALARSLKNSASLEPNKKPVNVNTRQSRMSPIKPSSRPSASRNDFENSGDIPSSNGDPSAPLRVLDVVNAQKPVRKTSDASGVLSAVPTRVSKSNGVDANWSGLRAPRASRRDRGSSGAAFSGSDSDYVRPKPKRPLPDIRTLSDTNGNASSASSTPKNFLSGGFLGTRRSPALGKSAWKAQFQPAPTRVMGEETFNADASLRKVRQLRRVRSAPGGLHELDNSKHILSIGYVHRHKPFQSEYEVGDAIGTGGFAVVRKATHRTSGKVYAVKTLRVRAGSNDSDDDSVDSDDDSGGENSDSNSDSNPKQRRLAAMSMAEMTNELIMMQQLSGHPNIVTVKEFFTEDAEGHLTDGVAQTALSSSPKKEPHEILMQGADDDDDEKDNDEKDAPQSGIVHVVMELLEGQELVDAIEQHGLYDESDAKIVMSKMLDAIAFMHARGVVHRDLKLENLVLAKPDDLRSVTLVDFGLAKALMARERAENVCGTLAYVAPEALAAGQYGQGVDVWALGVAMHVLLTGAWPFDDEDEDELMDSIIACELDFSETAHEEFSWISPDAVDLLTGLLEPNPKHRLTAAQALEHSWFTNQKSHKSDSIHHVHKRLDALSSSARQHPERRFHAGDSLVSIGDEVNEVFMVTSGEAQVSVPKSGPLAKAGEVEKIGVRRKGNLVGEIPSGGEGNTIPKSKLCVVAKTEVRALVFQASDVVWAVGHDYRLSDEFEMALRERRRLLAKKQRLAIRAERTAASGASANNANGFQENSRRAQSEVVRRQPV